MMADETTPTPVHPPETHETHETRDTYSVATTLSTSRTWALLDAIDPRIGSLAKWATGVGFSAWVAVTFVNYFLADARLRTAAEMKTNEWMTESNIKTNDRIAKATEESATANKRSEERLGIIEGFTKTFEFTNRKVDATLAALRESQDQACRNATVAAKGMSEQKPILEEIARQGKERTRLTNEMLIEQKTLKPAIEKMAREGHEEREGFWMPFRKQIAEEHKALADRLPPKMSPPIGVVPK